VNRQFHDNYKPLNYHLSEAPESSVLDQTVTNIGGLGDRLGNDSSIIITIIQVNTD